jgi:hypothetical protein
LACIAGLVSTTTGNTGCTGCVAGTYSTTYDRVLLEAGQDVVKTAPDPVQGAQNFVDQLNTPDFPWSAFTIVVVIAVSMAAVATRFLQSWANRGVASKT